MFISQLIRYARACSSYEYFILRVARLSCKLLVQEYVRGHLESSLMKLYGRYGDLMKHYEDPLSQMIHDILGHDHIQWQPPLIRRFTQSWPCYRTRPYYRFWPYYQILGGFHRTFATGATCQQRTLTPPDTWHSPIWDLHICNIETILSRACHVYGSFEFQTSLGTSILLFKVTILSMHLFPRMYVMLDFIFMGSIELPAGKDTK